MGLGIAGLGKRGGFRLLLLAGLVAGITAASMWGSGLLPGAFAQLGSQPQAPAAAPEPAAQWANRPVAYINNTQVVTMKDLGEYLIKREGAEKLELLVNKMIIEQACQKAGITVTAAEVDETLRSDLQGMSAGGALITEHDFVTKILRHYNKTLYEWKEDVIRPRLLMGKLCRSRVKVTDEDLRAAFDAYYGEKVACQIILWPKQEHAHVLEMYAKLRDDPAEFDRVAKSQASSSLAAKAGKVEPPFGRHTTGNEELEKAAFSLRVGEISSVIGTPQGDVIVKLNEKIPARKNVNFDQERPKLEKEIIEKKVQAEIPVCFKELREKAQPNLLIKKLEREEDVQREARQLIQESDTGPARPQTPAN